MTYGVWNLSADKEVRFDIIFSPFPSVGANILNLVSVALRPAGSPNTVDEGERMPCFTRVLFLFFSLIATFSFGAGPGTTELTYHGMVF